jgi:hypothetical protein
MFSHDIFRRGQYFVRKLLVERACIKAFDSCDLSFEDLAPVAAKKLILHYKDYPINAY